SFVGGDRRPPLRDGGDDLNDIALANLVDAPTAPALANLPAKEPGDLATGAGCDSGWAMNVSNRASTRSATLRPFASRFSAAGSRPARLAGNRFCAATRAR